MADVIGYAGQIIEVIQALRGVYLRVKGLGKEIDDAMADCGNMETDVSSLKKLFDKQTSSKFPEQVQIITKEFKSLHKSIKKLKKLFREYEKISLKWYGALVWAYDKPRESIMEILSGFASYRGIFTKALHIINEGHNKDHARELKEMRDQAKKASEDRKRENLETKRKLKAMDERSKKDAERLEKLLRELMAANQATPENRSKAVEGWLVTEKGMGKEEAKSCASTALREGKVPTSKTEEISKPKKADKESGTKKKPADKSDEASSRPKKDDNGKSNNNKISITKPDEAKKAEPQKGKATIKIEGPSLPKLTPVTIPKEAKKSKTSYNANDEKVIEVPKRQRESPKGGSLGLDQKEKEKGKEKQKSADAPVKKTEPISPKGDLHKHKTDKEKSPSPSSRRESIPPPKSESPKANSPSPSPNPRPPRKPKVPVILIQEPTTNTNNNSSNHKSKDAHHHNNTKTRSPSPAPSIKSSTSSATIITPAPHRSKRSPSISSTGSGSGSGSSHTAAVKTNPSTSLNTSQQTRERIEAGMRHVKHGASRGRSQDPPSHQARLGTKDQQEKRSRSRSEVRVLDWVAGVEEQASGGKRKGSRSGHSGET